MTKEMGWTALEDLSGRLRANYRAHLANYFVDDVRPRSPGTPMDMGT